MTQTHHGATRATVIRRYVTLHSTSRPRLAARWQTARHLIAPYTKAETCTTCCVFATGWLPTHLTLLNNALRQTVGPKPYPNEESWREMVRDRLHELDWVHVAADVRPFLEPAADSSLLTPENVRQVLEKRH